MATVTVGCSGFTYGDWRGTFYPEKLPQKRWLEFYSGIFPSVELNVTFYRLPTPETFQRWYQETPPSFSFVLKGSRFITHIKRLDDCEEAVQHYFDAALQLREKLKVVLWQLSPDFSLRLDRFRRFLQLIRNYPVRHTFEFRHESWLVPEVVNLCREYRISICSADSPEFLKDTPITADFVYIRRHGQSGSYTGCYTLEELERDAEMIRNHKAAGKDVYIYFNNDASGYAPRNARQLMEMMGVQY